MIFNSKSCWKWLSATLLPVLGFAGCGNPGDSPDLYGSPTSDYQFKGRVTDADGKPVEGIKGLKQNFRCMDFSKSVKFAA